MSMPALVPLAIQGRKPARGVRVGEVHHGVAPPDLGMVADPVVERRHAIAAQEREDLARHGDQLARARLDGQPGAGWRLHFQAGCVGEQKREIEPVLVRIGQEFAVMAARLVAVELQVRGAVAKEGQLRRPALGIVACQGLGQLGQQSLDAGRHGQRRAVHAPALAVGEAAGGVGVEQARPEGLGEVGAVGPVRVLLADGMVAVMLGQRVARLRASGRPKKASAARHSSAICSPSRSGQERTSRPSRSSCRARSAPRGGAGSNAPISRISGSALTLNG